MYVIMFVLFFLVTCQWFVQGSGFSGVFGCWRVAVPGFNGLVTYRTKSRECFLLYSFYLVYYLDYIMIFLPSYTIYCIPS